MIPTFPDFPEILVGGLHMSCSSHLISSKWDFYKTWECQGTLLECCNSKLNSKPRLISAHWSPQQHPPVARAPAGISHWSLPKANSSFGRLSFQFSAADDWNELQKSLKSETHISLTSFKHQLSEELTDHCTCTQPIYKQPIYLSLILILVFIYLAILHQYLYLHIHLLHIYHSSV